MPPVLVIKKQSSCVERLGRCPFFSHGYLVAFTAEELPRRPTHDLSLIPDLSRMPHCPLLPRECAALMALRGDRREQGKSKVQLQLRRGRPLFVLATLPESLDF